MAAMFFPGFAAQRNLRRKGNRTVGWKWVKAPKKKAPEYQRWAPYKRTLKIKILPRDSKYVATLMLVLGIYLRGPRT